MAVEAFEQLKNSYGHVDPQTWGAIRAEVQRYGLTNDDFTKAFSHYADPYRGDFEQAYGFKANLRSSKSSSSGKGSISSGW